MIHQAIGEFGMSKVVPKVYDKIKRKGVQQL